MNPYLSQFGYQGPNILFVFIIISLYYYKHLTNPYIYLSVLIWQLLSHLLNVVIKNTLRLPRPDSSTDAADAAEFEKIKNSVTWKNYIIIHRNFGMPSGHAQAVVSELTFLALYFQKPWLTLAASCQAALTIYQRYKTRRHSLNQLILGSLLGFVVGFSFYKGVKMYNI
jgi:membrane-associated phospholipid phosphatase